MNATGHCREATVHVRRGPDIGMSSDLAIMRLAAGARQRVHK
jgi:hypothetical protein